MLNLRHLAVAMTTTSSYCLHLLKYIVWNNTSLMLVDKVNYNFITKRGVILRFTALLPIAILNFIIIIIDRYNIVVISPFVQSWRRHMSVHFWPLTMQEHVGGLQHLLHWQDSSSRTACGAGWPPIQSTTSLSSSVHQSSPTGDGMFGRLCKQCLYTAAW